MKAICMGSILKRHDDCDDCRHSLLHEYCGDMWNDCMEPCFTVIGDFHWQEPCQSAPLRIAVIEALKERRSHEHHREEVNKGEIETSS